MVRLFLSFAQSGNWQVPGDGGHYEIYVDDTDEDGVGIVRRSGWDDIKHPDQVLGLFTVQGSHITLQSRCESCIVVPPELDPNLFPEPLGKISLQQSTQYCQYNVVLRPNDRVFLYFDKNSCPCSFGIHLDNVQVESSLPTTQAQRTAINEKPQQAYSPLEENGRASSKTSGSPEEASHIQKEDTERRTNDQAPAATPVAGSTGASQIVKDTPATDRRQDISLQNAHLAPRAQSGLRTRGMEGASSWQGNGSALSRSESMTTIDPRDLSKQHPEEDEDKATASEESDDEYDEEDLDTVKRLKPALESSHANGTSKFHSAKYEHTEKAGVSEDSCDDEVSQSNKERSSGQSNSSSVAITHPPRGSKRKALEEEPTRRAKRTGRVEESEDIWKSPSKSPAGYGRRAQAKLRAAKAAKDESKTPRSSNRSHRSSVDEEPEDSKGAPIRVVFSNSTVVDRHSPMRFLERQGVKVQDSVTSNRFDFLCVKSTGHVAKTFKLLMSVILGISIIADKWVTESHKAEKLLDTDDFIPTNAPPEWDWGDSPEDVVAALGRDRSRLFKGIKVVITPRLKTDYGSDKYNDVEKLLKASGAPKISSKLARAQDFDDQTIVIGAEKDDLDAVSFAKNGCRCFNKELVSISILRGQVDLDSDEFKLRSKAPKKTGKVGRPKKSK